MTPVTASERQALERRQEAPLATPTDLTADAARDKAGATHDRDVWFTKGEKARAWAAWCEPGFIGPGVTHTP